MVPRSKHRYQIAGLELDSPTVGEPIEDTKSRILRRIILEALPFMEEWVKEQLDEISYKTWLGVLKDKQNYTQVDVDQWKNFFEAWTERPSEVDVWTNPIGAKEIYLNIEKNPLIQRVEELAENQLQETLVFAWHLEGGLLVATGQKPGSNLPKIRTLITSQTPEGKPFWMWAWNKKNFYK